VSFGEVEGAFQTMADGVGSGGCLFAVTLFAVALVPWLAAQPRPAAGEVEFQVVNWHGRRLPQYSLTITARGGPGAREWKLSGAGPQTIRLPYGQYKAVAGASLHNDAEMEFAVKANRSVVVVSLQPSHWGESVVRYTELSGAVTGAGRRDVMVRLVSLFGDLRRQERAGPDGRFLFAEVPDGEYLLLVLEGSRILREVRVTKSPRLAPVTVPVASL
jgi:hypothetical protein